MMHAKKCPKCNLLHTEMSLGSLECLGVQETEENYELALFNCRCGTTFSIRVPRGTLDAARAWAGVVEVSS